MKIVASNSLTLSNVNDGTITHVAYANSADGTDGFYIGGGRNLLNNTDKDISVTSHTTDGYPAWANIDTGFSFEHGKTYTFSAEAKNSTDKIAEASIRVFENSTNTAVVIYAFPADGKRHSITFTIPNDSHNYRLLLYAGHAGIVPGVDITTTYHHQKLEEGDVSTPWSPAPSEAHPSYIGQYTDFTSADSTDPSKYTWSLIKGDKGDKGERGIQGPAGSNGDPGKVVSDTEPSTRFKGLTWKYLGTSDLTASDGTVILSGTEYYWSGTNWILSEINAHNINGDNLNVTNGKFTDGVIETSWKNGPVAGSTNIENDHLIITRTDSSVNTTNSIGLDSTQGLIMVYTENSTGRTISVGTNFQGMSLTDSTGISASISPAGVKLSSDVNWTQIGNIGGRRAEWKRENNRVTMNIHGGNGDRFPVVTSGGTLLGILPTNARPPSDISMPATAQGAGATAQISINSTGEVRCYRWGGDSVYFGAYISYYVE